MSCSTVVPGRTSVLSRVSRSAALAWLAAAAIWPATCWNTSVLATKSVSQFSSTSTPAWVPSSSAATRPLAAVRMARLFTSLAPLRRSNSSAACRSPLASSGAFLQSIMPAPVCSRSRFTSAAVKFAMSSSLTQILRQCPRLFVGARGCFVGARGCFVGACGLLVSDARQVVGLVGRSGGLAGDRGSSIDLALGGTFGRGGVHGLRVGRDLRVRRVCGCFLGSCHLIGGLEGGGGGRRIPGALKQLALPLGQRLLSAGHATCVLLIDTAST